MKRFMWILLLIVGTRVYAQQPVKSVDAMIRTTLVLVAKSWLFQDGNQLIDYDHNHILGTEDAAILFYHHYPDKAGCGIWSNAYLDYTFNVVKLEDGTWIMVDSLAYTIPDPKGYEMKDRHGDRYDPDYNYDAWYKYGRYCK